MYLRVLLVSYILLIFLESEVIFIASYNSLVSLVSTKYSVQTHRLTPEMLEITLFQHITCNCKL